MAKVIGVCGTIGSGKNTVANYFIKNNYTAMAIADPIKIILQDLFTIPTNILWGASEQRTGEVRRMLQLFGTDFARAFDEDVWVKKLLYRITSWFNTGEDPYDLCPPDKEGVHKNVIVTDVRFPNEAKALVEIFGAKIIRVVRPNLIDTQDPEARQHPSETCQKDIPEELISETIINTGILEELRERAFRAQQKLAL